jgi:hypothetical protein
MVIPVFTSILFIQRLMITKMLVYTPVTYEHVLTDWEGNVEGSSTNLNELANKLELGYYPEDTLQEEYLLVNGENAIKDLFKDYPLPIQQELKSYKQTPAGIYFKPYSIF